MTYTTYEQSKKIVRHSWATGEWRRYEPRSNQRVAPKWVVTIDYIGDKEPYEARFFGEVQALVFLNRELATGTVKRHSLEKLEETAQRHQLAA